MVAAPVLPGDRGGTRREPEDGGAEFSLVLLQGSRTSGLGFDGLRGSRSTASSPRLPRISAPGHRGLPLRGLRLGARGPAQTAAGSPPHPSPPPRHHLYIHRARVPLPLRPRWGRVAAGARGPGVPSPDHARDASSGGCGHQRPRARLAPALGSLLLLSRVSFTL